MTEHITVVHAQARAAGTAGFEGCVGQGLGPAGDIFEVNLRRDEHCEFLMPMLGSGLRNLACGVKAFEQVGLAILAGEIVDGEGMEYTAGKSMAIRGMETMESYHNDIGQLVIGCTNCLQGFANSDEAWDEVGKMRARVLGG